MQGETCIEQWASFQAFSQPEVATSPAFCALCPQAYGVHQHRATPDHITKQLLYIYAMRSGLEARFTMLFVMLRDGGLTALYKNRAKIGPVSV